MGGGLSDGIEIDRALGRERGAQLAAQGGSQFDPFVYFHHSIFAQERQRVPVRWFWKREGNSLPFFDLCI